MIIQVTFIVLTSLAGSLAGVNHFENCTAGWIFYQATNGTSSCLWYNNAPALRLGHANNKCSKLNSSLFIVDTSEKFDLLKNKRPFSMSQLWIGLQRNNTKLYWLTKDGPIKAEKVPFNVPLDTYFDPDGLYLSSGYINKAGYRDRYAIRFVCERQAVCENGWFGASCDRQCHCYEEECDPSAVELKCSYGCQIGWMGQDCSKKKEDATVRYFCVNSEDQGKYAHVIIETKGVQYQNINPIDGHGEWVSWCNNTVLYAIEGDTSVTHIKIYVDNQTTKAIKEGSCAGQITNTGSYEWKLKIQEIDGLVSRNDQEMSIECDFTGGDTFLLSSKTDIKRESMYKKANIKRPIAYLEEKKEHVKLELIDPAKNEVVNDISLGTPVAIRIAYGLQPGNMATGVRPYNCIASTPGREKTANILDANGCAVKGNPISEFHKSTSKTIMTNPFPLFGFDGFKDIEFHCSYTLCFQAEECQAGCKQSHKQRKHRHRRNAENGNSFIISSIIKIKHPF